ncbi:helix-turn-helix transcriptional regulator [Kineococcus glutinatus]|uniref:HTH cro/C1-type domain-containing protein n=1 Tax=Kineococcus glutinatus TaxID=1070872 RepID=A0ABP9HIJ0_9ACTN
MVLLRSLLGAALRSARRDRNRTLRDVAKAAGVSLGYLSEVERGRKEPSSEVLAAICAALGLRLSDLLVTAQLELQAEESRVREQRRREPVVHQLAGAPAAPAARHRVARAQLHAAPRRAVRQVALPVVSGAAATAARLAA